MQPWPTMLVGVLAQAALVQVISVLLVRSLIRPVAAESPATCRMACFLAVLQGCLLVPLTISIPWYDPPSEEAAVVSAAVLPEVKTATADSRPLRGGNARAEGGDSSPGQRAEAESTWSAVWRGVASRASRLLAAIWLVGMVALAGRAVLGYGRFLATLPPRLPCPQPWRQQWLRLWSRHGRGRAIPLEITRRHGPMLCLLPWGYRLLVPEGFWRASTPRQREVVLRHEIAHWRRGDVWKSWLVRLLALPQWFNPAAWWAVRAFEESAEWSCDRIAASTVPERTDYAKALQRLAALGLPLGVVGRCAHCHPLVTRIQFLLCSPSEERFVMRKTLIVGTAAALMLVQAVRVELVARGEELTRAAAEEKIAQFDQRIDELSDSADGLGEKADALEEEVEAKIKSLEALADEFWNLSGETQRRAALFETGLEASQLEAIKGADKLGDEGILLLALAAEESPHQAVRRKALEEAVGLGKKGYPALVHSYESLPEDDRVFLVRALGKNATTEDLIGLLLIVQDDQSEKVRKAAFEAGVASPQGLLFVAALADEADHAGDEQVVELIETAAKKIKGEDGLLVLYAAAHGKPAHQIAAIKAAVAHKQEGLVVLVPAFDSTDPEVRAQLVCAAKQIGGNLAQFVIDEALGDSNAELREAAEKGLKDAEAKQAPQPQAAKAKKPAA